MPFEAAPSPSPIAERNERPSWTSAVHRLYSAQKDLRAVSAAAERLVGPKKAEPWFALFACQLREGHPLAWFTETTLLALAKKPTPSGARQSAQLTRIIRLEAEHGRWQQALLRLRELSDDLGDERPGALFAVLRAMTERGYTAAAKDLVQEFGCNEEEVLDGLLEIASAKIDCKDPNAAHAVNAATDHALATPGLVRHGDQQLLRLQGATGDLAGVRRLLQALEEDGDAARAIAAEAAANAGKVDAALALLAEIKDRSYADTVRTRIATPVAAAGRPEDAYALAEAIDNPRERRSTLASVAAHDDPVKTFTDPSDGRRPKAFALDVATQLIQRGRLNEAAALTETVADPDQRFKTLVEIGVRQDESGDFVGARRTMERIDLSGCGGTEDERLETLARTAGGQTAIRIFIAAEKFAAIEASVRKSVAGAIKQGEEIGVKILDPGFELARGYARRGLPGDGAAFVRDWLELASRDASARLRNKANWLQQGTIASLTEALWEQGSPLWQDALACQRRFSKNRADRLLLARTEQRLGLPSWRARADALLEDKDVPDLGAAISAIFELHMAAPDRRKATGTEMFPEDLPDLFEDALARRDRRAVRELGGLATKELWLRLRESLEARGFVHALILLDLGFLETHAPDAETRARIFGPAAELFARLDTDAETPLAIHQAIVRVLSLTAQDAPTAKRAFVEGAARARRGERNVGTRLVPLIGALIEVADPGARLEALRLAATSAVSDARLIYFLRRLVDKKALPAGILPGLANPRERAALRRLVNEAPGHAVNALELVDGTRPLADELPTLFAAIRDLGALTPRLYERYRLADGAERETLVARVRALRPRFFGNEPLRGLLGPDDAGLLAEMVMVAFRPQGMTFRQVEQLLGGLADRSEDIADLRFPDEGYAFVPKTGGYGLRAGEHEDPKAAANAFSLLSYAFASPNGTVDPTEDAASRRANLPILSRIIHGGTDLAPKDVQILLRDLSRSLALELGHERRKELREASDAASKVRALEFLQEALSTKFLDRFPACIDVEHMDMDEAKRFQPLLCRDDLMRRLLDKLGRKSEALPARDGKKEVARCRLVAEFIYKLILEKAYVNPIKRERKKYVATDEGPNPTDETSAARDLRLMVSKNAASFFAKASAGICTAQDVELFNRPDHFHLNLVEGSDVVRANIQAYLIDDPEVLGKKSLLLRGFNPNEDFLQGVSIGGFCQEALRIARTLARESGLAHVYLSESLGAWHALSNRDAVQEYLVKKIQPTCRPVETDFAIAGTNRIRTMYRLPEALPDAPKTSVSPGPSRAILPPWNASSFPPSPTA